MLAMSRKQALFLLIILSLLVALAIVTTVIRVADPNLWQHIANGILPQVLNHY